MHLETATYHKENILNKSQKNKNPRNYIRLQNLTEIDNFGRKLIKQLSPKNLKIPKQEAPPRRQQVLSKNLS
jgi:hypothetical protein